MMATEAQMPVPVELPVPEECRELYRRAGELVRLAANNRAEYGDAESAGIMEDAQALYRQGHVLNPYINQSILGE
jgi:hypothetical protein